MRPLLAVVVAASCGLPAFGAPPERAGGRFVDVLHVGDRVAVRTWGEGVPTEGASIRIISDEAELATMLPTSEERKEYEDIKSGDAGPPTLPARATAEEQQEYNEKLKQLTERVARRSELRLKTGIEAGRVTAVGADYVAIQTDGGATDRWPVRQIARVTGGANRDQAAAPGTVPADSASATQQAPHLLDALHPGDEVVLQTSSSGPVSVYVGMKDDLKDRIATPEERQEYADLGDTPGYEPIPIPAPGGGGLDQMRKTLEDRRLRRERVAVLRPKVEYEVVRLTAIGGDFVAFEKSGITTYLPLHRIGLVLVKSQTADSPAPKAE